MANGRKKNKSTLFSGVRFFKSTSSVETVSSSSSTRSLPADESATVSIPMASLATRATRPSSMSSQSSSTSIDESCVWCSAVQRNDLTTVNWLLSRGSDINAPISPEGWSALHVAVWNNWIDLIQLLIASGCDLDVMGPGAVTPLALASQRGYTVAVQLLVGAGCDVTRRAEFKMTVATSTSNAKTSNNVGSNYFRCRNVTAVHLAARYGHLGVLRCLVSAGASVDSAMTVADHVGGVTPLHLAVEAGHIDIIDYLIVAGSDVNTSTRALTSGRFVAKDC